MKLSWWVPLCLLLVAPMAAAGSEEPKERLSDIFETANEAWAEQGFRLALRFGWESLGGFDDAPSASGFLFAIHPSARISANWSAGAVLQYTLLGAPLSGVRFVTGLTIGWHPWRGFELELGAGYAGQLVSGCDGSGATGQLRAGYLFAVGDLFATGPVLQGEIMGTKCAGSFLTQRQLQASWAFAWR